MYVQHIDLVLKCKLIVYFIPHVYVNVQCYMTGYQEMEKALQEVHA